MPDPTTGARPPVRPRFNRAVDTVQAPPCSISSVPGKERDDAAQRRLLDRTEQAGQQLKPHGMTKEMQDSQRSS